MDSIANYDYLWNGKLSDREKFIVQGLIEPTRALTNPGVYFLWNKDGLQYIGQSWFIWMRLAVWRHPVVNKKNMREWIVGIIPVADKQERKQLEAYCIKTFRPPRNNRHNAPG